MKHSEARVRVRVRAGVKVRFRVSERRARTMYDWKPCPTHAYHKLVLEFVDRFLFFFFGYLYSLYAFTNLSELL